LSICRSPAAILFDNIVEQPPMAKCRNKTAKIRASLAERPDASTKEIIQTLAVQRVRVSACYIGCACAFIRPPLRNPMKTRLNAVGDWFQIFVIGDSHGLLALCLSNCRLPYRNESHSRICLNQRRGVRTCSCNGDPWTHARACCQRFRNAAANGRVSTVPSATDTVSLAKVSL
jgi:hypothetical protein